MFCGEQKRRTHVEALGVAAEDAREVQLLHLLLEARREARVHGRAAGEDDVLVQVATDVDGRGLDRLEEELCGCMRVSAEGSVDSSRVARTGDTGLLDVDEVRLEHALGRLEALRADLDDAAVGKLQDRGGQRVGPSQAADCTHLVVLDEAGCLVG